MRRGGVNVDSWKEKATAEKAASSGNAPISMMMDGFFSTPSAESAESVPSESSTEPPVDRNFDVKGFRTVEPAVLLSPAVARAVRAARLADAALGRVTRGIKEGIGPEVHTDAETCEDCRSADAFDGGQGYNGTVPPAPEPPFCRSSTSASTVRWPRVERTTWHVNITPGVATCRGV